MQNPGGNCFELGVNTYSHNYNFAPQKYLESIGIGLHNNAVAEIGSYQGLKRKFFEDLEGSSSTKPLQQASKYRSHEETRDKIPPEHPTFDFGGNMRNEVFPMTEKSNPLEEASTNHFTNPLTCFPNVQQTEIIQKSTLHTIINPGKPTRISSFMNHQLGKKKIKLHMFNLEDIIKCEALPEEIRYSLGQISSMNQQYGQKDTSTNQYKIITACKILRQKLSHELALGTNKARQKFSNKVKDFHKFHDTSVWYTYWLERTNIDFKSYMEYSITSKKLQLIFPSFLYYVQMIITIIPLEKELNDEDMLDYMTEQLIETSELFVGLHNFLIMPWLPGEKKLNNKRNLILKIFRNRELNIGQNLWYFLETWMEVKHHKLWKELIGEKGVLSVIFKCFLNNVFYHGVSDLTKFVSKVKELIN
jgi:hypothetical protein